MGKRGSGERGKRRRRRDSGKEAFWLGLVREQAASVLGVRAFCQDKGVAEASFYYWRRELRLRRLEKKSAEPEVFSGRTRKSAVPGRIAAQGGSGEPETASLMPSAFAEVRLRDVHASEIEVRRGEVSVVFRGGCDGAILREVLSVLGGTSC